MHADVFAERMRALGGVPAGTIRQAAQAWRIPDLETRELPWREVVQMLSERYERYAQHLRDGAQRPGDEGDLATQDIYLEAIREADQQAWFLCAHLSEQQASR